jgi:hypothetical protein
MDNEKIKDEKQAMVPYFLHESEMARLERIVKRMWILCIIMFLALVITNAGWVYYENQFEDMVIEQYVHSERDRRILKRRLVDGVCYEPLAEEFDLSVRQVKTIVYKAQERLFSHL